MSKGKPKKPPQQPLRKGYQPRPTTRPDGRGHQPPPSTKPENLTPPPSGTAASPPKGKTGTGQTSEG